MAHIALGSVLVALARPAVADVISVPGEVVSLQTAIGQAQDGDVIELASGSYAAPAGGFRISNEQVGFTVRAAPGATVVLDGEGQRPVLVFQNSSLAWGRPVHFERIVFRNGFSNTAGLTAVTIQFGEATFRDCRFENNVQTGNGASLATGGGGVHVSADSMVTFERSVWADNESQTTGGGLQVSGHSTVQVRDSQFLRNRTNPPGHPPDFSGGGAIHVGNSALQVVRTRFERNESGYAGGALFAIGVWNDSAGGARVTIDNCTFEANAARRNQPSSASAFPTEGGALHAEALADVVIRDSRFVENEGHLGGAVNLYRAAVTIEQSVFRGNRATGAETLGLKSLGGAVAAFSNDLGEDADINRPAARVVLTNSLLQGRHGATTIAADVGGCLFATGDTYRAFGLGGVPAMGTLAENRAQVTVDGVIFHDCDVEQDLVGGSGYGGGMFLALSELALTDSIVIDSDAVGSPSGGGGAALAAYSGATLDDVALAGNSAGTWGGALMTQGAHVEVSASSFLHNEASPGVAEQCFEAQGAAIFAAQAEDFSGTQADADATGFVTDSLFSSNVGIAINDDDRQPGPINDLRYAGNAFYAPHFTGPVAGAVYNHAINPPPALCVTGAALSSHVVTRSGGPSTPKGVLPDGMPSPPNVDLASAPAVVALVVAPTHTLLINAMGDPSPPEPVFLGMAWEGSAQLNGVPLAGSTALVEATAGTYTLAAGGAQDTVQVPEPYAPSAALASAVGLLLRRLGSSPSASVRGAGAGAPCGSPRGRRADRAGARRGDTPQRK